MKHKKSLMSSKQNLMRKSKSLKGDLTRFKGQLVHKAHKVRKGFKVIKVSKALKVIQDNKVREVR